MNPGQVGRRLTKIGDPLRGGSLACEPRVDRPLAGIVLGGFPGRERHGDGERQQRREPRQPPALLLQLTAVLLTPG